MHIHMDGYDKVRMKQEHVSLNVCIYIYVCMYVCMYNMYTCVYVHVCT
jgi:hypothetical protein